MEKDWRRRRGIQAALSSHRDTHTSFCKESHIKMDRYWAFLEHRTKDNRRNLRKWGWLPGKVVTCSISREADRRRQRNSLQQQEVLLDRLFVFHFALKSDESAERIPFNWSRRHMMLDKKTQGPSGSKRQSVVCRSPGGGPCRWRTPSGLHFSCLFMCSKIWPLTASSGLVLCP